MARARASLAMVRVTRCPRRRGAWRSDAL